MGKDTWASFLRGTAIHCWVTKHISLAPLEQRLSFISIKLVKAPLPLKVLFGILFLHSILPVCLLHFQVLWPLETCESQRQTETSWHTFRSWQISPFRHHLYLTTLFTFMISGRAWSTWSIPRDSLLMNFNMASHNPATKQTKERAEDLVHFWPPRLTHSAPAMAAGMSSTLSLLKSSTRGLTLQPGCRRRGQS